MDGRIEVLSGNVPERDVDSAESAHDHGTTKMGPAVEILPVVFDLERVLPDEIFGKARHRGRRALLERPGTRLAQAYDAGVGLDLHEQVAIDEDRSDALDTHASVLRLVTVVVKEGTR